MAVNEYFKPKLGYNWSLETRDQEENFFLISKKNYVLNLSKSAL